MNILILGSAGFIGSSLVKHFQETASVWGCDLLELPSPSYPYRKVSILSPDFESYISSEKFDVCINASGSSTVGYSFESPVSDFEANSVVVARVLDALRKFQPGCRFVQISSAAVYGNPVSLPVKEDHKPAPVSPYGYHKWMSELLCREYGEAFRVPSVILRPFSVYGPGLRKQLLWDTCMMMKNSGKAQLKGSGNESRDFIHIKDLCRAIEIIIQKGKFTGEVYNLASGEEVLIKDLAEMLSAHFNAEVDFSGQKKTGDPVNWKASIEQLSSMGFNPTVNLREGVKDYAAWFKQNA